MRCQNSELDFLAAIEPHADSYRTDPTGAMSVGTGSGGFAAGFVSSYEKADLDLLQMCGRSP